MNAETELKFRVAPRKLVARGHNQRRHLRAGVTLFAQRRGDFADRLLCQHVIAWREMRPIELMGETVQPPIHPQTAAAPFVPSAKLDRVGRARNHRMLNCENGTLH